MKVSKQLQVIITLLSISALCTVAVIASNTVDSAETYLPTVFNPIPLPTPTPSPTPVPTPMPTPSNCDPSYPTVCIPPPPPDLDCGDIPYRNFTVLPPDPHGFDSDGDGIGCET